MGRIRISSPDPDVRGCAYLTVTTGKPLIILVNGHWNRVLNKIGIAPGVGEEGYWNYFLQSGRFKMFIHNAQSFFCDSDYQEKPCYIDGSTLLGGDASGSQRKTKGYKYALENFKKITQNVGNQKVYIISHSEGCAFAAGVAKCLMEKGVKVGESIMLAADEGDEFDVEGNYPCYQLVAGWLSNYQEPNTLKQKTVFAVDPIVRDHMVKGVNKYGVFIQNGGSWKTVHGGIVSRDVFNLITQLKNVRAMQMFTKDGSIVYYAEPDPNQIWHKINDRYMNNKRIDTFYHNHMKKERKD